MDEVARQRILNCQDRGRLKTWPLVAARIESASRRFD